MNQSQMIPVEKPERTSRQWIVPTLLMLILVGGPWTAAAILGENRAAIPAIAIMILAPFVLGLIDGRTFRMSVTFIVLAVVGNFIAGELFYNDGAFIYTIGVGLSAWLGAKLGEATSAKLVEKAR